MPGFDAVERRGLMRGSEMLQQRIAACFSLHEVIDKISVVIQIIVFIYISVLFTAKVKIIFKICTKFILLGK